jgi:two-component system, chemotaxis family, response regulator Rcp1
MLLPHCESINFEVMFLMNDSRPYFLYIEDDVEDVELLKHVLTDSVFDFNIIHLTTGVEALNFLQECKRYSRFPELIFLDVNLSKMNGKETLVCLKADKDIAKIPLTILSTSNLDTDISYFRKFHIPYIVKPGDVNRFKDELSEVMKGLLAFDVDFSSSRKKTDAA